MHTSNQSCRFRDPANGPVNRRLCVLCVLCVSALVTGCAVGPNYSKPDTEIPAQFKEAGGDWVLAKPADAQPKGNWWELFQDPVLNALEGEVQVSNQDLRAAEARYREARAAVQAARSQFFPTVGGSASAARSRNTPDRYQVSLDANWELDLWGRIRRLTESATTGEQASAADLENARLSLQAQLAATYFQLRVTDAAQSLLDDTITAFQRSYEVTQNRYKAGVAARVDVVQADTQLLGAQANAIDLRVSRAQLEHAIAVLTGKPPANVTVEKIPFKAHIPQIPPGLPSTLLERRPDVAAAERRMAQANARIGVAQAAYFPALTLSGSGGFASTSLATLFDPASRFWSLGADLAGTLLDFGGRAAAVDTARAQYDESVATYRQAVLVAFQEVEDNLAASRWYAEETKVQEDATRAARESVLLTGNQYRAGTVSLLNLIVVQAAQLNAERDMMTLLGRRLTAQVALIRAIGGSW